MTRLLISLLFAVQTIALGATLTWTAPTTRTDGTPLQLSEIGSYDLFMDNSLLFENISASATSAIVTGFTGVHTFTMRTTDTGGLISPLSAPLTADFGIPPQTPSGLVICEDPTPEPEPTPTPVELSQGKTTAASSYRDSLYPRLAVDDNASTRWGSNYSDPQWIRVDLGAVRSISRVTLLWEAAYAKAYKIQVSSDLSTWTTVYSTTSGDGSTDDISFAPVAARYVRVYGTVRATSYGYSLWDFAVYGL